MAGRRSRVAAGGTESPSGSAGGRRVAEQRHRVLQVVLSHRAAAPGGAEGPNGSAEWSTGGIGWSTGGAEGPRVGAGAAAAGNGLITSIVAAAWKGAATTSSFEGVDEDRRRTAGRRKPDL